MTGLEAIRWIESFCRIPSGPGAGGPVRLLPFQRKILHGIFDTPTRRAIISMGRQNGKTSFAAFLTLLHLCGPAHQRNATLVSAALTRDQSGLLFSTCVKIIRASPELAATVEVVEFNKLLRCRELGTSYRALSADAPTQLGVAAPFVVHDELGAVRGPIWPLFDVLESGMAVQRDPLSVIISTQAASDADLLSRLIDDAQTGADPQVKLFLWTAPMDLDPFSPPAWKAANPAAGKFVSLVELRGLAETARRMPSREPSFRNLNLNQRVETHSPFVSPAVWLENGAEPSEWTKDTVVRGGLDLSSVNDLTALVLVSQDGSVRPICWLPEEGIAEKSRLDKTDYVGWARDGFLELTPGRAISYDMVAQRLRRVFDSVKVEAIAFDRVFMKFLLPCLTRAGFTEEELGRFVECGQGFIGMGPAIRELEVRLLEKRLRHGNHPVLEMCASNAAVIVDDAGNKKFTKRKSTGRIDALVALAMAVVGAVEVPYESVYERRGLLDLSEPPKEPEAPNVLWMNPVVYDDED